MRSQLITLDGRLILMDGKSSQPFRTNVVVAFRKRKTAFVVSIVQIGEVKKEPHVECLADGSELLHERMIETREVSILQRCDNRARKRHGTRFDRIARVFCALKIDLRKNIEAMLGKTVVLRLEIGCDERVMDLAQRAGQLLAGATSPLGATNEPHELALGE